ncbi:MAG: glycosyltransferase [Pseudomonadota bacterium]
MPNPTISVVMPCYNAAAHLRETIASLQAQTLECWELIAIDDGSTDRTSEVLTKAAEGDLRIRVLRIPNGGPSRARNVGVLGLARSPLVAFLDADDLCRPRRLARIVEHFTARPRSAAAYGRVSFFRGDAACPDTASTIRRRPLDASVLLGENPVCTTSNLAIRFDAFRAIGGFDERLAHHEDVDLLLRIAADGRRIEGIDEVLVDYRMSESGLSADLEAMRTGWQRTLERFAAHTPIDQATGRRAEAIHLRYLARRALRTHADPRLARRLALQGLCRSPAAFFDIPRRGALTLGGSLLAPLLPARLCSRLFA